MQNAILHYTSLLSDLIQNASCLSECFSFDRVVGLFESCLVASNSYAPLPLKTPSLPVVAKVTSIQSSFADNNLKWAIISKDEGILRLLSLRPLLLLPQIPAELWILLLYPHLYPPMSLQLLPRPV